MSLYLLSVVEPVGPTPPAEFLEPIMARLAVINDEIKAAGGWVFAGGLHGTETATTISPRDDGEVLVTDGPFAEGKEHLGGISEEHTSELQSHQLSRMPSSA